jgi:molybdopterin/thiamine biosynthesis adenylyltransferase
MRQGIAMTQSQQLDEGAAGRAVAVPWSYDEAFARNRGLVTAEEQQKLRASRVAIVGMGGVGGSDLVTLARLGIGRFTIADPDHFEVANTNRQYGASLPTLGQSKAEVMARVVQDINPGAEIRIFNEAIGPHNAEEFLQDADVLVDGLEVFEVEVRRILFRLAARRGIYALSAGPVGFSTVWVIIDPRGMTFDQYFGLRDGMDPIQQFVAFIIGMAPRATQRAYMDLSSINLAARTGPSLSLACQLSAGVVGAEILKILLKRGRLYAAPHYHQFDTYVGRYVRGRLLLAGASHPLQRFKRWWLNRYLLRQEAGRATSGPEPVTA